MAALVVPAPWSLRGLVRAPVPVEEPRRCTQENLLLFHFPSLLAGTVPRWRSPISRDRRLSLPPGLRASAPRSGRWAEGRHLREALGYECLVEQLASRAPDVGECTVEGVDAFLIKLQGYILAFELLCGERRRLWAEWLYGLPRVHGLRRVNVDKPDATFAFDWTVYLDSVLVHTRQQPSATRCRSTAQGRTIRDGPR
jgi:hypothetical protein